MNKFDNKIIKIIIICSFFLLFLVGTLLLFYIPTSVRIYYNLTIETDDGTTIIFNVYEPNNNVKNRKAVIIGHGIMDSKEWMRGYAIEFAASGFVAVTLDFRGHGMSGGELNYKLLINDIKAIKNYLNSRGDIDMSNLSYLGFSMGGYPGNEIVKQDNSFKCFIGVGTILNITKDDLKPNRQLNILMIHAKFDEVFSLDGLKYSMSRLLNISRDKIIPNRLYGSFKDKNASMLYLDDNSDHVFIAWDQDFIREARDWLLNTYPDVYPVDTNFYVNIRAFFLFLQLLGGFVFYYLIISEISKLILKKKDKNNKIKEINISDISTKKIYFKNFIYTLVIGIPSMLLMFPIVLVLPLPIASAMIMFLFGIILSIILTFRILAKKSDQTIWNIIQTPIKDSKSQLIKNILLGIISASILLLILYLSVGFNNYGIIPSITKLPWSIIYFAFNIFAFYILSILFNIIIQPKINGSKNKQIISSFLLYFIYLMGILSLIIVSICFIFNNFFLIMVLVIAPPYLLLIAFNSSYLYEKTGNIIGGIITNALIATSIACAFSPYMNPIYLLPILFL